MEALVLIGGFIYIGVLGFWAMGKIDRFIGEGGFLPDQGEEEDREVVLKTGKSKIFGNADPSKIGD